jgi:DHA1 family tetracycline resistance protein-like MFS transporter
MSQAAMDVPPQEPAAPKGALGIIFLIVLMDLLGFGIIIPLLPLYAEQYKASALEVGLLMSIYSICQFIASPILGSISDKYGRRAVLVYSQLGSVVGYLLLGVVMQFHWTVPAMALTLIYLSRLIDGLSGGNVSTAQAYISDVTTPENRAKGMGLLGAAFGIGFAIGPAAGGLLGKIHQSLPGYFAAAASAVAMVMTFYRLPESRRHKPTESAVWLHPSQFRPILQNTRLTQLLLIVFLSMCGFVQIETMGALFLSQKDTFNWGTLGIGLYFGFAGIVIAIVQGGLIGRLVRRFGDWPLAIAGPLLVALGMLNLVYMNYHPILWLLLIGGAINSAGRSLQTPTLFALISKNSDRRQQGVVFGMNQGLGSLARVIGPAVGGLLYERMPSAPFALAAGISLLVCLWTAALHRQAKTPVPAAAEPI